MTLVQKRWLRRIARQISASPNRALCSLEAEGLLERDSETKGPDTRWKLTPAGEETVARLKAEQKLFLMMTATISGKQCSQWCWAIASSAGLEKGDVDWHSYAGRHLIFVRGTRRDREKALAAMYDRLPVLRRMYTEALDALGDKPTGYRVIGIPMSPDGARLESESVYLNDDE